MKVHRVEIDYRPYQTVTLPNGAAPLSVESDTTEMNLYFIGPDTLLGEYMTTFGVFVVPTGVEFPEDLRIFPVKHPLIGTVDQPNARYLATVNHHHIFLGAARETLTV